MEKSQKGPIINTNGYHLYTGTKHSYVIDQIKRLGYYEHDIDTIKYYINKGDVVLDIGANIGYYTIMFSKLAGMVYAFEPNKENYDILMENIKLNECDNVRCYNMAVGDVTGVHKLWISDECMGMHRMYKSKYTTNNTEEVKIIKIDDVIRHQKISFVKIDVEGYEGKVLRGMNNLLKYNEKLTMWVEMTEEGEKEAGGSLKDTKAFLKNHGFIISSDDNRNYWCVKS